MDEHDSLSSLFTENIYNDFFKLCDDTPTKFPQKTLRQCRTFNDTVMCNLT